jgi:hypothetical protein
MSLLSNAQQYCKDMKDRSQKQYSIPKEQKYCQPVLIILPVYGKLKQESYFRLLKDTKMKFFHANLTMKVILLLLVLKITRAVFGEIPNRSKSQNQRNDR